jgi:hypothetical protein
VLTEDTVPVNTCSRPFPYMFTFSST